MHTNYRSIVLAIIQSAQWKEALCHTDGQMTPFKRMIQQMPCKQDMWSFRWDAVCFMEFGIFTRRIHSLPSTLHHVSHVVWLAVAFSVIEYVTCTLYAHLLHGSREVLPFKVAHQCHFSYFSMLCLNVMFHLWTMGLYMVFPSPLTCS